MADKIYDLAMNIARKESQNPFAADSFADEMQMAQLIQSIRTQTKNNQMVRDNNQLSQLVKNLGSINTEQGFNNFETLMQGTSVHPENQISLDTIENVFTSKRAAYNAGKEVYAKVNPTIGMNIDDDKYFLTPDKILNGDFGKDADGNPIRLAYGTNGIDWLKKEMEEVATDIAHLESAGAYKYGRNPNSQVLGKLKDYQKNLNETFLASTGGIHEDEARTIIFADDYSKVQDTTIKNLDRQITAKQNLMNKYDATMNNLIKGMNTGNTAAVQMILSGMNQDEQMNMDIDALDASNKNVLWVIENLKGRKEQIFGLIQDDYKTRAFWSPKSPLRTGPGLEGVEGGPDSVAFNEYASELDKADPYEKLLDKQFGEGWVSEEGGRRGPESDIVLDENTIDSSLSINDTVNQTIDVTNNMASLQNEINSIIEEGKNAGFSEEDLMAGEGGSVLADKRQELENLQSQLIQGSNYPDELIQKDENGFMNVEAISDFISENKNAVVTGGGALAVGTYLVSQSDLVQKTIPGALDYLKLAGNLSEADISQIFNDARIQKHLGTLDELEKTYKNVDWDTISKYQKKVKTPLGLKKVLKGGAITSKADYLKAQRAAVNELAEIFQEKGIKLNGKDVQWVDTIHGENVYFDEDVLGEDGKVKNKKGDIKHRKGSVKRADKDAYKHLNKILSERSKWNLFKLKGAMGGLNQIWKTGGDVLTGIGRAGLTIGPFDAAIYGWMLGDKLDLGRSGQAVTALGGYVGTQQLIKYFTKEGRLLQAMKNPVLQSKLGKWAKGKLPWLAKKLGLAGVKGVAGAGLTSSGLGVALGGYFLYDAAKTINEVIAVAPELKQMFSEYMTGMYDDKYAEEYFKDDSVKFDAETLLDTFNEEFTEAYKTLTGPKILEGTTGPITKSRQVKDTAETDKRLSEFQDKYNLNPKTMRYLRELKKAKEPINEAEFKYPEDVKKKRQKRIERLEKSINKELKKLGLLHLELI